MFVVGVIGCSVPDLSNFTAVMSGTLSVVFVNETPFSVSTFYGVYNPLDAAHGVVVKSVTLAGGASSTAEETVPTSRNLDVAGALLRLAAQLGSPAGVDPNAITDNISFLNADNTTAGTAPAGRFFVGVDYGSNDFIEIHFKQVPGTTDQFTVEMKASPPDTGQ